MCCTDGLACPFGCHADHENDELDEESTLVYSRPGQQEELPEE